MITWCFVVVSDGLLTALRLGMFVYKLRIWELQPQRAKMVCTLTAVHWVSPDSWRVHEEQRSSTVSGWLPAL